MANDCACNVPAQEMSIVKARRTTIQLRSHQDFPTWIYQKICYLGFQTK